MEKLLRKAESKPPLGEILFRRHLITAQNLAKALDIQQRSGSRLGDILIGEGLLGYFDLYHAVAESNGLPFIDLLKEPPDPGLPDSADSDMYLLLRLMPWRREDENILIAVCEVTPEVLVWVRERYGQNFTLVITSPFDINRTVESLFSTKLEKQSRLTLWQHSPSASARTTLIPQQKKWSAALLLAGMAAALLHPLGTLLALIFLCHCAYAITMLFKCRVFMAGMRGARPDTWNSRLARMAPHTLPVYTVLVPMYKEAASLPGMLHAMQQLDYPAAKLDIKLVLEADDEETLAAAFAMKPRYQFDIVRVPPGHPRTKPKACNYALRFARGEFITIFDADDRPEPTQLKKAIYAFSTLPRDVVCLQARLNYYNVDDNLLTRFFSLEYSILFDYMLAGLERLGIPIPLGGTSNHIAFERLQSMGEWDPYNVTEDADLGTRIAAEGFRTAMLDSYTLEEAPNRMVPWIRQRSRWIKGYMQTWLVHMRNPGKLYRTLGGKGFIGFQFFIGLSTFTFLSAPLVWIISLQGLGFTGGGYVIPGWLIGFSLVNLMANIGSSWFFTSYCAYHSHAHRSMWSAALLYPLYLVLHSIASYKALWQLMVKPHFWEKTSHGLCLRSARNPFQSM
jgi:glycosyltransferase XagB